MAKSTPINPITTDIQNENEQLKTQLAKMQLMMEQLMESQKTVTTTPKVEESDPVLDENIIQIQPNQLINVTSLFQGGLNLMGAHGKPIRFNTFGQTMPITFEDINFICSNNRSFAEKGYFFIHSSTAIKLLYLQDYYEKIINAKTIESIINLSNDKIRDIYNSTTTAIQQTIIDIIIKGIQDNNEACRDRNKIEFISTLSGKDLEKIAKELKEFEDK